jgi:hypothetical protein
MGVFRASIRLFQWLSFKSLAGFLLLVVPMFALLLYGGV